MQKLRPKRHVQALTLLTGVFFIFFPTIQTQATAQENPVKNWQKLASYTTYFNEGDIDRSENISIASSLIDNIVLQAYGEFSFNQTVGRRTAEAGFKQAKIIVNGEYVLGVGGGVCQVSTTLYNCALLSGLEATEYHPHSLLVSYVAPSRDAMVSTQSDLKLYNPHDYPVRLQSRMFEGGITVSFYSECKIDEYALVSVKTGEIPPPPPVVKEGADEEILKQERVGIKSELYLERYKKGKLILRKRLRKDEYRPTQGIIVKKIENPSD